MTKDPYTNKEVTFEDVTKSIREALEQLQSAHAKTFGDIHPVAMCLHARSVLVKKLENGTIELEQLPRQT